VNQRCSGRRHSAGAARIVGQAILLVAMALRAAKGDENPAFPGLSKKPRKAGQGASRGPGGPPYFGSVFDRGHARGFGLSQRRLKAGGSQNGCPT
jgi:hypothetical protein